LAQTAVRYERNPDFVFRKIVEECILVPIRQDVADMDCIYTLNEVGAYLWEHLDQPATMADLQNALLEEFAADPEVLASDLDNFLSEMVSITALREV
jgi:hypothetical protein